MVKHLFIRSLLSGNGTWFKLLSSFHSINYALTALLMYNVKFVFNTNECWWLFIIYIVQFDFNIIYLKAACAMYLLLKSISKKLNKIYYLIHPEIQTLIYTFFIVPCNKRSQLGECQQSVT